MNMHCEPPDPIPGAVRQLVGLFEEDLADVEFPGVGLQSLEHAMAKVQTHAEQLQALEVQVSAARQALDERRRELTKHAEQAVAYVRVFASGRPELLQKLASIELGKATNAAPPKRGRGRPRGRTPSEAAGSELPLELPTPPADAVATASDPPDTSAASAPAPKRSPRSSLKVAAPS